MMVKINVSGLLYATVASIIIWFLLWFAYDIMKVSQGLNSATFANLTVATCLIVFVILLLGLGGIEPQKKARA